ncbi:hypothetical protein Halhy_6775 (plasmid) [Haliscomenobacter hydrossis DSM 1100]|uniref:Uncharacterized protein n=1 Tax=Haliscomenobacter hydrossis (strain ATCC 27775 / DSM 1100 / LMG 10767 / O) TaxID=760192 RepID=F4L880_HALH1|nr:hypothetical protein Halhy_6775 [Haliscomenobacter hydrossis DSM 1100]
MALGCSGSYRRPVVLKRFGEAESTRFVVFTKQMNLDNKTTSLLKCPP